MFVAGSSPVFPAPWRPRGDLERFLDQQKLTKRVLDGAEPRDVRYIIFDTLIAGFGLRVYPSGAKSWIFEYRAGSGGRSEAKKRITISRASDLTADEARKQADKLRTLVKTGHDPAAAKAEHRAAPTVEALGEAFLEEVRIKRSEGTYDHYSDLLNRIIIPAVGATKAKDLTHAEMGKLHRAWKDTPFQANRILACVSSMYSWGGRPQVKMVPVGMNPTEGIEKYEEPSRERPLSNDELMRLGDSLRLAETAGIPWKIRVEKRSSKHLAREDRRVTVQSEHVVAAIRLLMFTGARLREILNLRWDQVDFDRGLLMLNRKHKTGRTTGVKTIVLNAPALAVLTELTRFGQFVIAGEFAGTADEKPRPDIKKAWESIAGHAGIEDLRANDLRHNFASFGVGGGMGLPIVGKLLGHRKASTTERYAHLAADPLRLASNAIGSGIASAVGETPKTDNVVQIGSRKK